jgi:dTDP-4-amino-4,6-dideoxygalactose transaminase
MTDIQAALGSAQMDSAAEIVAERQRLAAVYDRAFAGLSTLRTPICPPGYEHGYQSYPCLFQPEPITSEAIPRINIARNQWMDQLLQAGISTRPATHAVHMLSYYRDKYKLKPADFPSAWAANDCTVSLPIFRGMTGEEQAYVIEQVLTWHGSHY